MFMKKLLKLKFENESIMQVGIVGSIALVSAKVIVNTIIFIRRIGHQAISHH